MIWFAPTTCQASRNRATAVNPTTVRAEPWRASDRQVELLPAGACATTLMSGALMSRRCSRRRLLPRIRRQHLLLQQIPDALAVGREGGVVADFERARPFERHRDVGDDPAR